MERLMGQRFDPTDFEPMSAFAGRAGELVRRSSSHKLGVSGSETEERSPLIGPVESRLLRVSSASATKGKPFAIIWIVRRALGHGIELAHPEPINKEHRKGAKDENGEAQKRPRETAASKRKTGQPQSRTRGESFPHSRLG
jgi:hypothetical protein